ncbi:MAG: RNA methyltransferase [Clostridia bacterium]|nr:RNA methyltransferase [Clostridia bacterium]
MRVNTLKCSKEEFLSKTSLTLTPLEYEECGFILVEREGVGNTAAHHSGEIYLQDPGAMATVNAVRLEKGMICADLCSAPGGKSSQIAEKIGEAGFLLANEFLPKRAKIAVGNFERLGLKNTVVTSLDTKELPKLFSEFFDLVLLDAPCSGEGLFRKNSEASEEWSVSGVRTCAERQDYIFENAAPLVKEGGRLLYSTCTFSLEENEMRVAAFLSRHPEFELIEVEEAVRRSTADGIAFEGCKIDNIKLCRRFYPHIHPGEGQFIALMRKTEGKNPKRRIFYSDSSAPLKKSERDIVRRFFRDNMKTDRTDEVRRHGENLVIIPHGYPLMPRSVFCAGVLLGHIQKGVLTPSHQFFSAYGDEFLRRERILGSDARLEAYLRGEEIDAKEVSENGWCSIAFGNTSLGGAKAVSGRLKNHYPKGLRKP